LITNDTPRGQTKERKGSMGEAVKGTKEDVYGKLGWGDKKNRPDKGTKKGLKRGRCMQAGGGET